MRPRVWVGFAAFCLLSGSTWLRPYLLPSAWPELLQIAVHDGVVCGALAVAWLAGRNAAGRARPAWQALLEAACWAAILFVAVPLLNAAVSEHVEGTTGVLVVALVPALTVFFEAQHGRLEGLGCLLPALVGLGGLALLVPFRSPVDATGWAGLAGLVAGSILLVLAGLRLWSLLRGMPLLPVATLGSGLASLAGLGGWRVLQPQTFSRGGLMTELAWALAVDGTLVVLALWLVREMPPTAFSARFLLIPWVTLVGGLAAAQGRPSWIAAAGLVLVPAGSFWLLRGATEARADGMDSRTDLKRPTG